MSKGYIHVYTGDGKGKTTAAIGLAIRAAGNGFNVFIAQFAKGQSTSETNVLKTIPNITIAQYGTESFITNQPIGEVIKKTQAGFLEAKELILSNKYDMVILDEINIALYYKMISINDVIGIMEDKPYHMELILTGRKAPADIIAKADLVTEMKNLKHYYDLNVSARKGIEY